MRFIWIWVVGGLIGCALAGCAGAAPTPAAEMALQALPSASPSPSAPLTPIASPAPLPTETGPRTLMIWMPDVLAPTDNADAEVQRAVWITAFETLEGDLTVTMRLKRAADVGGIFQTLRSASLVAPTALPDLALLRRVDLLAAVALGLVRPLDPTGVTALIQDMYPSEIALGSVEGDLYALPFTVDVAHLALNPEAALTDSDAWTFDAVLSRRDTLLFPAGRAGIANETFLAQYRAAAAGATTQDEGVPVDAAALEAVFSFYQSARTAEIIPASVLDYTAANDYIDQVITGTAAGVISSSSFLTLRDSGTALAFAPLPTRDGEPAALIDGWMWVITTGDAARQADALRFLSWVFDVDRHADYTRALHMLPTGRATLRQSADPDYAQFAEALIDRATLPLSDSAGGVAGRAMQAALIAVLRGERTAEAAAQDVIEQAG
ncbi:MAG: extracellular solute-binding protein [Anaerolineae bacterium]|nr:extracellular solute-binding protein [Anaerolineae bacterium]NUQ04873.1 extracellular solute-binding protein [Anaerolineae bacterium]